MPRCIAIADCTGKPCRSAVLQGEDKCFFHSKSDRAQKARLRRGSALTKNDMVLELQRQLSKVKRAEHVEPLEKSREIRAILYQINNLQTGEILPVEKEKEEKIDTFEERVKKSMEKEK